MKYNKTVKQQHSSNTLNLYNKKMRCRSFINIVV